MKITKEELIIGILAIAVIVIVGYTQQVRESTTPPQISKQSYGGTDYQGVLDMLNGAEMVDRSLDYGPVGTCNDICGETGKTCVNALLLAIYDQNDCVDGCRDYRTWGVTCSTPGNLAVQDGYSISGYLNCWCAEPL